MWPPPHERAHSAAPIPRVSEVSPTPPAVSLCLCLSVSASPPRAGSTTPAFGAASHCRRYQSETGEERELGGAGRCAYAPNFVAPSTLEIAASGGLAYSSRTVRPTPTPPASSSGATHTPKNLRPTTVLRLGHVTELGRASNGPTAAAEENARITLDVEHAPRGRRGPCQLGLRGLGGRSVRLFLRCQKMARRKSWENFALLLVVRTHRYSARHSFAPVRAFDWLPLWEP